MIFFFMFHIVFMKKAATDRIQYCNAICGILSFNVLSAVAPLSFFDPFQGYALPFASQSDIPAYPSVLAGIQHRLFSFLSKGECITHAMIVWSEPCSQAADRMPALRLYESESLPDVLQKTFCCIRISGRLHILVWSWNSY